MSNKGFACSLNIMSGIQDGILESMASQEFDKLAGKIKPKVLEMVKQGHLKYELRLEVLDSPGEGFEFRGIILGD